jgi:hypothetical protein
MSFLIIKHPYTNGMIGYYDKRNAREVAIALSQNLILFNKGRRSRRGRQ